MEPPQSSDIQPIRLERYSFLWSEARLVIAAIALLIGGVPVLRAILPMASLFAVVGAFLTLAWIVSGIASAYLLYRWIKAKRKIFGGNKPLDTAAFLVSVISGINLGITGLTARNIGMSIFSSYALFVIGAIIYVAAAVYLWKQWKASGERLFA